MNNKELDTISRQAAIDIAKDLLIQMEEYHQYNQAVNNYCAELVKLPSAQPYDYSDGYADGYKQGQKDAQPQRTGKWIDGRCNQCDNHAPFWSMATTYYESNYCPNCGAKMKEGEVDEC